MSTPVTVINQFGVGMQGRLVYSEYANDVQTRGRRIRLSIDILVGDNDNEALDSMSQFFQSARVNNVYRTELPVLEPNSIRIVQAPAIDHVFQETNRVLNQITRRPGVVVDSVVGSESEQRDRYATASTPRRSSDIITLSSLLNYSASVYEINPVKYDILVIEDLGEIYYWQGDCWNFVSRISDRLLPNAWRIGHTTGNGNENDIRVYNGNGWVKITEANYLRIYRGIRQTSFPNPSKNNELEWINSASYKWVFDNTKKPKKPIRKVHDIDISTEDFDND